MAYYRKPPTPAKITFPIIVNLVAGCQQEKFRTFFRLPVRFNQSASFVRV